MWFLLWKLFSKSEESWWRVFTCWEVRSFTQWCNAEECELSSSCPRRDELNSEGQKKKIRAVCVALITQSETQCRQRYESWETRARSAPCGTEGDADHPQEGSKGPVHPSPLQSIKAHCVTVITLHDTTQRKMKQTGWNFYDAAELKVKHLPGAGKETREGQKRRLH